MVLTSTGRTSTSSRPAAGVFNELCFAIRWRSQYGKNEARVAYAYERGLVRRVRKGYKQSRLSDLLRALEQFDFKLAKDVDDEIRPFQKRLPFRLNFDRCAPEAVMLAGHCTRKDNTVRLFPPHGSAERGDQHLCRADAMQRDGDDVSTPTGEDREPRSMPVEA